jgi:teichuronic acid biosynthesis glycosyltransferase TuaG
MPPLVSVVMPAFNAERHIAESIQSVLDQTFADWELVVVDDGSTDRTADVAAGFHDSRMRYLRQENRGQAAARNTGIRSSSAPFVAFLDADDLWLPGKLEAQLNAIHNTGADLVYCDGYVFYDDGSPERSDFFAIVPGTTDGPTMLGLLYEYNRIATLSVMVKRAAIDQAGLFDEDRRFQNCEDYELWLRLARSGCLFHGSSEKLVRYRRHSGSTTHHESRMLGPMIEVIKKHQDCVSRSTALRRIRELYRGLVTSLIKEGDIAGARKAMRSFGTWDRAGLVTQCQRLLLRLSPGAFVRVSRGLLYPTEWHLTRFLDKRGAV